MQGLDIEALVNVFAAALDAGGRAPQRARREAGRSARRRGKRPRRGAVPRCAAPTASYTPSPLYPLPSLPSGAYTGVCTNTL